MLDENELLFDELYEKTKDCGRVQFINLLMEKERENNELREYFEAAKEVAQEHKKNEIKLKDRLEEQRKEYQEIKKQLEEGILESLYFDMITDENIIFKNQQKEFIEWLESNLEALEMCDRELILTNNKKEIKAYKEVLSKYKEIIGVKDE